MIHNYKVLQDVFNKLRINKVSALGLAIFSLIHVFVHDYVSRFSMCGYGVLRFKMQRIYVPDACIC
jgi:hypothetical protein